DIVTTLRKRGVRREALPTFIADFLEVDFDLDVACPAELLLLLPTEPPVRGFHLLAHDPLLRVDLNDVTEYRKGGATLRHPTIGAGGRRGAPVGRQAPEGRSCPSARAVQPHGGNLPPPCVMILFPDRRFRCSDPCSSSPSCSPRRRAPPRPPSSPRRPPRL